jgi:hypothetical protein
MIRCTLVLLLLYLSIENGNLENGKKLYLLSFPLNDDKMSNHTPNFQV